MVITRANYQIALRLIHSLSRFIPVANQTDHPLTNTNLFLSAAVPPPFPASFSTIRLSLRPPVPLPHSHKIQSVVNVDRRSFAFKQRR